jgi:hypothetical protein
MCVRIVLSTVLLVSIAAAIVARPVTAQSGIGVALDTGRVDVTQRLSKGGTYQLPVVGVRNPGSEAATYTMGTSFLEGQSGRRVPEGWFSFSPQRFTIAPGSTQPVRVTLDIPTRARPDTYAALLHAQVAPSGEGAQIGAAAAAPVTFAVRPSTLPEAWLLRGRSLLADHAPWWYVLPSLALAALALRWLTRRFRFRLERRP